MLYGRRPTIVETPSIDNPVNLAFSEWVEGSLSITNSEETQEIELGVLRGLKTTVDPTYTDSKGDYYLADIGLYNKNGSFGTLKNIETKKTSSITISASEIATWFSN